MDALTDSKDPMAPNETEKVKQHKGTALCSGLDVRVLCARIGRSVVSTHHRATVGRYQLHSVAERKTAAAYA